MITNTDASSVLSAKVRPRLYRYSVAQMRIAATTSMRRVTLNPHPAFPLGPMNFAGAPSGIDLLQRASR